MACGLLLALGDSMVELIVGSFSVMTELMIGTWMDMGQSGVTLQPLVNFMDPLGIKVDKATKSKTAEHKTGKKQTKTQEWKNVEDAVRLKLNFSLEQVTAM